MNLYLPGQFRGLHNSYVRIFHRFTSYLQIQPFAMQRKTAAALHSAHLPDSCGGGIALGNQYLYSVEAVWI